jgi:predicted transcriptional regulator
MPSQDYYDLAENRLKAFTRSAVRTKIMLRLAKGDMAVGQLETDMAIRGSTILHSMKELIEENIVKRTNRNEYELTNVGMIEALLIDELVSAIVILDKHKDFWLNHDLRGMPIELLAKIGMLAEAEIIKGDPAAILKSHEHFMTELMKSREVFGVSPIILPDYPQAIAKLIEDKSSVKLIVTKTLLGIMKQDHRNILEDLLKNEHFELYSLNQDLKTAFTVTDKGLSLGFFRIDGSYDVGSDLICYGKSAREWGLELFEYYKSLSNKIKIIK